MLGLCPRTNELHLAGEDVRQTSKGMFIITTNGESPFASGQWTISQSPKYPSNSRRDPFFERIDEYGKLESAFNFANSYHKLPTNVQQQQQHRPYEEQLTNQIIPNEYGIPSGVGGTGIGGGLSTGIGVNPTTMGNISGSGGGGSGGSGGDIDKSRFDLDDNLKLDSTTTTEKWRQNDKFILGENPLATASILNGTLSKVIMQYHRRHQQQHQQQQYQQFGSSDGFQFPKVTYS